MLTEKDEKSLGSELKAWSDLASRHLKEGCNKKLAIQSRRVITLVSIVYGLHKQLGEIQNAKNKNQTEITSEECV